MLLYLLNSQIITQSVFFVLENLDQLDNLNTGFDYFGDYLFQFVVRLSSNFNHFNRSEFSEVEKITAGL